MSLADLLRPAPWHGLALSLATALAWSLLCRLLRRPLLAGLGAGLGLAVGWILTLGLLTGSPRQLPERLPAQALGGLLAGLAMVLAGRRVWLVMVLATFAVAAAAWWLAGGPLTGADLRRSGILLLAVAVLGAAALLALRILAEATAALALLGAGLWAFGPPGPWCILAFGAAAAAIGAWPGGGAWGAGSRGASGAGPALPMAIGLAALAAGPVLARGQAADWLVAAAPFAALWIGPALGARLAPHIGGRAGVPLGWLVAGGLPLIFALLSRHAH